ncbi:hypothetical protein OOK36_53135 [Streptomyces sp. NBC_00365]|nr:hypothetical protein [Streptomyces sp. NBC_00365]MCX5097255.1 hypothetical protein [Streptomyces sp. NBC_00365]
MLLDPDDVDEDGEWAAYWLASWSGEGPERYGSFHDLMRRQWVSFHALRKPPGATRDHSDTEVERARCEALAGAVVGPLAVFAQADEYGRERADVLSMQMKAMLGDWRRHIASLMWYRPGNDDLLLSPLFAAELLPLLVRQDQLAHPHDLRPLLRPKEYAPAPVRALVADYQARTAEPGFRLTFGGPQFDAAVYTVTDRLAGMPAFQAPDEPPIRTGPIVVTLYAARGPNPTRCPTPPRSARVRPARPDPWRRGAAPVVEAGPGDAEDGAQPLHAVTALMVGDELEAAAHQLVSPAKYFAALRRISRSCRSSAFCLRSAAFSASNDVDAAGPATWCVT